MSGSHNKPESGARLAQQHQFGKLRRGALAVPALAVVGSLCVACGSSAAGVSHAAKAKAAAEPTYALVPGLTTDPGYITMFCGAKAEAKKLGVKIDYQGSTTFDPTKQIPVVQSILTLKPAGLILTPDDAAALAPVVKQFDAAHIPVVSLDTTLNDHALLVSRITSSGTQGGSEAAKALAAAIGGKGQVALMSGNSSATTDQARVKGFEATIKANYPNISVVSLQYSGDVISTATAQAQSVLLAHPSLKGFFAVDGNTATGVGDAVNAAGKKGKVVVAGYDAEPAAVKELQNGTLKILVIQDFAKEGQLGVQAVYDDLHGKRSEIKTSVALPNIIATAKNVNSPAIKKYFYESSCSTH